MAFDLMDQFFGWIDPVLSAPYLWLGHQTFFGFLAATVPLALASILVGEASMWVARKVLGREIKARSDKVQRYHDISLKALEQQDRATFNAADKVAKEAFGQSFVLGLCLGMGSIWPCFFALAWLQHRFGYAHTVKLPLVGWNLGYIGAFIICYILVRIAYALVKARVRRARAAPAQGD